MDDSVRQHKYVLDEDQMPTTWYNIMADLPAPPPPPLHPGRMEPVGPDDLAPLFPMDLIMQEVSTERYIEIPGGVLDVYRQWRPSPLFRAHRLEKALGTPARIYYKYEGVSPAGSHKPNTAVPQAYYNAKAGTTKLTTETGAGQWGTALAFACALYGIDCEVWQVGASYDAKPYRRLMIEAFGGTRPPLAVGPHRGRARARGRPEELSGSLGIAITEAVEVAAKDPNTRYALGSVLNHVLLHQTIIGEEALLQLRDGRRHARPTSSAAPAAARTSPACPSRSCARSWPARSTREILAVEPASCPSLTKGVYAYDFGDTAGMTPLMKMHTLGHDFIPDPIHAGGLRYHGMAPLISHVYELGLHRGRRRPADRVLRRRRAVRPHRGHRPGARADPRARRWRSARRSRPRRPARRTSSSPRSAATGTSTSPPTTPTSTARMVDEEVSDARFAEALATLPHGERLAPPIQSKAPAVRCERRALRRSVG